jgi:hypothetical protein
MSLRPTRVESRAHQLRADALPLTLRQYRHGRQTDRRWSWLPIPDLHRGEQNVADDVRSGDRDERNRTR